MSLVAAPQGLRVSSHKSGDPRFAPYPMVDGILSGLTSNIFTGSPVKMNIDGTIIPATTTAADPIYGIFAGCEYTRPDGTRYIGPMWASGYTYIAKSCIAKVVPINDPGVYLIGQSKAAVNLVNRGEGINLGDNVQGSTQLGLSTQGLGAPTGATAASFTIQDIVLQPDNDWGDTYVWLLVSVQTLQGPVA